MTFFMREKELRLALICYGGVSLAVYMHGITKEIWRLTSASRAYQDHTSSRGLAETAASAAPAVSVPANPAPANPAPANPAPANPATGVSANEVYQALFERIEASAKIRLRVLTDIVAGASAGGINSVFLARAIASGESLEPLTELWLEGADVDRLLDPEARPGSRITKFWAAPIAWLAAKKHRKIIKKTLVGDRTGDGWEEMSNKLSRFVRSRWFEPPFGGKTFSHLLLDAFDAMRAADIGRPLIPKNQPVDLFVTVTDFAGYVIPLALHSPAMVKEREYRLILSFSNEGAIGCNLDDSAALAAAARATASFPGAFPPFTLREFDAVLAERKRAWPQRDAFVRAQLPTDKDGGSAEDHSYIDGSVLANAPFRPAIDALRHRPARREVDRRFVYIEPMPDNRSVSRGKAVDHEDDGHAEAPGFFSTIIGALSAIPREQPIRENVEMIAAMSARIRRIQNIVESMRVEVEDKIPALFGLSFFLYSPTPGQLGKWRTKAQQEAAVRAGYAYAPYGHLKLSAVTEDIAALAARLSGANDESAREALRRLVNQAIRARGLDRISATSGAGAKEVAIDFFKDHDLGFRIRRLRFLARELDTRIETRRNDQNPAIETMRNVIFEGLGLYIERQSDHWYKDLQDALPQDGADWLDAVAKRKGLEGIDRQVDSMFATAFAKLPRNERRVMLLAYLGYPFYDVASLPLLQGEGVGEFDPIKIDRISPSDAVAIRKGDAESLLHGTELQSFGAFFSRTYRENDYLWGRLHGADRLLDIVASSVTGKDQLSADETTAFKRQAFHAILDEEEKRLTLIQPLIAQIREEINSDKSDKPT